MSIAVRHSNPALQRSAISKNCPNYSNEYKGVFSVEDKIVGTSEDEKRFLQISMDSSEQ